MMLLEEMRMHAQYFESRGWEPPGLILSRQEFEALRAYVTTWPDRSIRIYGIPLGVMAPLDGIPEGYERNPNIKD